MSRLIKELLSEPQYVLRENVTTNQAYQKLYQYEEAGVEPHEIRRLLEMVVGLENTCRSLKENCLQWHDLEENPKDLPEEGVTCLVFSQQNGYVVARYEQKEWFWTSGVIRWTELPNMERFND